MARPRDQDWYFVDVDSGPLALSINGAQTDLDLYVVRNDNEIVLRSEGSTGIESLSADITQQQRLQILVNPFADATTAATGPYSLTLRCTAAADTPPPDPVDPSGEGEGEGEGEVRAVAAPLAAGGCASSPDDAITPLSLALLVAVRRRRRR